MYSIWKAQERVINTLIPLENTPSNRSCNGSEKDITIKHTIWSKRLNVSWVLENREHSCKRQEISIWVFDYCSTLLKCFLVSSLPFSKGFAALHWQNTEPLYYKKGMDVGFYSFAVSSSLSSELLLNLSCLYGRS